MCPPSESLSIITGDFIMHSLLGSVHSYCLDARLVEELTISSAVQSIRGLLLQSKVARKANKQEAPSGSTGVQVRL